MNQIESKNTIPGYKALYRKEEDDYLLTIKKGVTGAPPKETHNGWVKGREYSVEMDVASDGRFMFYKSPAHFREPSGYAMHSTIDDLKGLFNLIFSEVVVLKVPIKQPKKK
jgi:hypothetical protein